MIKSLLVVVLFLALHQWDCRPVVDAFSTVSVSGRPSRDADNVDVPIHPIGRATIDYSTASEYIQEHYNITDYFGRSFDAEGVASHRRQEYVFDARKGILIDGDEDSPDGKKGISMRPASFDDCGFQLFHAPTKVRNFCDMDDIRQQYVKELKESLIPRALGFVDGDGIESITLWHPVVRGEDGSLEPRSDERPSMGPVASRAHIDTDVGAYGLEGVCNLVDKNRVDAVDVPSATDDPGRSTSASKTSITDELMAACEGCRRVILLNLWRPMVPVKSSPLGILATRYDPAIPLQRAVFPLAAPDTSSTSRWYIFSDMQPDECLVFKQYDRRLDKISDLWHCALPDLSEAHPSDVALAGWSTNQPRKSFDIKAMIVLKERVPSHLDRSNVARPPQLTLEESGEFCNSQARRLEG